MEKNSRIFVSGHNGLVGSAIIRELRKQGYDNLLTATRSECDLLFMDQVADFFHFMRPEYVFNAAAKVGGINANNTQSAEFIRDNLVSQTNIIECCRMFGVKKLLFLGSSCIYPRDCAQPIKEEYLMTGPLEQTNIGYAVAKIAGITMCNMYRKQYGSNFISVMPTNLYGINDNFNYQDSHVLPALIRKFHEAKINNYKYVEFWGTGSPRREFLFVDDLAQALVFLMDNYNEVGHVNVGCGNDVTVKELAHTLKKVIDYEGEIMWNTSYPDGTPQKLLDVSKINSLGWKATTSLEDGLKITYDWFVENYDTIRK
jgi:GDP-L-fucose synthase